MTRAASYTERGGRGLRVDGPRRRTRRDVEETRFVFATALGNLGAAAVNRIRRPSMPRLLAAVGAFDAASEALGLGVAALLLLIVRLAMPERARDQLRLPFWALVLHIVAFVLAHALPIDSGARELLGPFALACLLVSVARSGVLLVVDVALGRRLMLSSRCSATTTSAPSPR